MLTQAPASHLYYLLITDDNQTPRLASFAELFPDGIATGTTSEEVAALAPGELYHGGPWAVVACDPEFLVAAHAVAGAVAGVEELAAAYLTDSRAGLERAQIEAAWTRVY